MKKNVWLILLAPLVLAACQDNTAKQQAAIPAATEHSAQAVTPAQPAATLSETPASAAASPSGSADQSAAESKALKVEVTDTVAVTKPEKVGVGATVQQSMAQARADAAATASGLVGETKTVVPAATAKAIQPKKASTSKSSVAAVKSVVSEKPVAVPAAVPLTAAGDAAKGKRLAQKCKACHNFTAKKKVGPGLKGVFGRKAGSMPGMRYSPALAAGGWVWDDKNLAAWVCDSKKALKTLSGNASAKTKMSVQRICDAGKQADLIAFLKTL